MKNAVIIYNKKSGKQKFIKTLDYVISRLKRSYDKVTCFETKHNGHAVSLATKACYKNIDLLVIVGGDGTFNECLNGIMKCNNKPTLGYIPAGTCCDIANTLGISKNVKKAVDNILNGTKVKLDVVKSNDLYFGYVSGSGAFIDISYVADSKNKKSLGYFAYVMQGAREVFTIPKMKLEVKHDNGIEIGEYALILILNFNKVAGFNLVGKSILDDGLVDVILYKHVSPLNPLNIVLSLIFPKLKLRAIKKLTTSKLEIASDELSAWNIDGESGNIGNQVIEVCQKEISIIVSEQTKKRCFKNQEV